MWIHDSPQKKLITLGLLYHEIASGNCINDPWWKWIYPSLKMHGLIANCPQPLGMILPTVPMPEAGPLIETDGMHDDCWCCHMHSRWFQ